MLTEWRESRSQKRMRAFPTIFCALLVLFLLVAPPVRGGNPSDDEKSRAPVHQLVILVDINPNQKSVLSVELSLAESAIPKLKQPDNFFSIITFGCLPPTLLKSDVSADEAVSALRHVEVERKATDEVSAHMREGLNLALGQFTDDSRSKSILLISEGHDYFPGKTFQQTLIRARQSMVGVYVAVVASHTFYGTRGIQHYGFNLRKLAGKTHGRYIEIGSRQKKVPAAVDRIRESILSLTQPK